MLEQFETDPVAELNVHEQQIRFGILQKPLLGGFQTGQYFNDFHVLRYSGDFGLQLTGDERLVFDDDCFYHGCGFV